MNYNGVWQLTCQTSNPAIKDRFPGGEYDLLFDVDILNLLLKNNGRRDRGPHFVIFVVWSALIVNEWVVVAWGRKSYLGPDEISSFVYLVQFKDRGCRVSLRIHLFFLMWIQGMTILCERGWVLRFSCMTPGMERFSLDRPQAVKKGCFSELRCGVCVEFIFVGQKFFDFVIWSCGKQWEILLVTMSECCLWGCRLLTAKSRSRRGASTGAASSYIIVSHCPLLKDLGTCKVFPPVDQSHTEDDSSTLQILFTHSTIKLSFSSSLIFEKSTASSETLFETF